MSDEAAQHAFLRGTHLLEVGRHEEAAAFFRESIAHDASYAAAFANLSRCLLEIEGKKEEALGAIDGAIALEPEESYYHALRSMVLVERHKNGEALRAAQEAVRLSPGEPFTHATEARAHLAAEKWAAAEICARRALAIDGDFDYAQNILAMALRLQGRLEENEIEVDRLLANNPEDEMTHVNAGYGALQRGDRERAEAHFREALRIDPEFEAARQGLIASFRARSWFYRLYLRYCFFFQKFSGGTRFAMVIGIWLAYRFGQKMLSTVHPALGVLLGIAYLCLFFWVWLARGVGNFIILLDRSARFALQRKEVLDALFVGAAFFLGIAVFAAGLLAGLPAALPVALGLGLGAIPASMVFLNDSKAGRFLFGGVLAYLYLTAIAAAGSRWLYGPGTDAYELASSAFGFGITATFICTFLGAVGPLNRSGA